MVRVGCVVVDACVLVSRREKVVEDRPLRVLGSRLTSVAVARVGAWGTRSEALESATWVGDGSLEHPRQWLGAHWRGLFHWECRTNQRRQARLEKAQEPSSGSARAAFDRAAVPPLAVAEKDIM